MKEINTERILREYVQAFNRTDEENVVQAVPNAAAEDWLLARAPRIAVPDAEIQRTYYFRWWVYRKHVKRTPEGFVLTEFHPDVSWAGKYNTIPCAAAHHVREGRWLRESGFLDDYIRFWYADGGVHLHDYSNALEAAVEGLALLRGDETGLDLLPAMQESYARWKRERQGALGLYWSTDNRDGSEFSISGPGLRPTLNCYQYAGARAIAALARRKGDAALSQQMEQEAAALRAQINQRLWDEELRFYVTLPQKAPDTAPYFSADRHARELFGYLPWMFGAAQPGRADAFAQLTDPLGFAGKYGPTTAERRHPGFGIFYTGAELNEWLQRRGEKPCGPEGHECLWNGPSWPFATSMMLTALANLLVSGEEQAFIGKADYLALLRQYAAAHVRRREDGTVIPWIDEDLNPDTGDWISRTRLMHWGGQRFPAEKGGYERGKDYNHSTFCDLVLEGLFGVRPGWDVLRIAPLFPEAWDYAVLEGVETHGKSLSIRYRRGEGYQVLLDGKAAFSAPVPTPCTLPWET